MTDQFSRRHPFNKHMSILAVLVLWASVAPAQDTSSWSRIGLPGSYVRIIRIDPVTPTTVYAALVHDDDHPLGGVSKSTDAGTTWNPANNGLPPDSGIYALTIDPSNHLTLYLGVDNYGWQGGGIYKSIDGGDSWNVLSARVDWGYLSLAVSPVNPLTVYAGTDSWGMLMSSDGGTTWAAANNGLPAWSSVNSVVIDPQTPLTVYAGTTAGLFKSIDGGNSWNEFDSALPAGSNIGSIAIDPLTPSTVYAGLNGNSGMDGGGLFQSPDGGVTWKALNLVTTVYGIHTIAINPLSPNNVYVGTFGGGVFKSTDFGANWSDFNSGLDDPLVHTIAANPVTPTTLYVGTCNSGAYISISQ